MNWNNFWKHFESVVPVHTRVSWEGPEEGQVNEGILLENKPERWDEEPPHEDIPAHELAERLRLRVQVLAPDRTQSPPLPKHPHTLQYNIDGKWLSLVEVMYLP